MLALERPGASGDQGVYADRIELQNVKGRFPLPDFTGAYKYSARLGLRRASPACSREIKWDDVLDDQFDLSGNATGWGINLSSNLKLGKTPPRIRLQFVFGEGIQNYMNDSPVDIGIVDNPADPRAPIDGEADSDHRHGRLPRPQLERHSSRSSIGYSRRTSTTRDGQAPDAFKTGQYALGNLLYYARART